MLTSVDGDRFETYARYLRTEEYSAAAAAIGDGHRVILGLRRPTNAHANEGRGLYDDTFVVLWKDGETEHALEFAGNTEPSAYYEDTGDGTTSSGNSALGEDADGDGVRDLGRIPVGIHRYRKGTSQKYGDRVLRSIGPIRAERDINHDGNFDDADTEASVDANSMMVNDFLFHPGLPDRTGSAGCQTMEPEIYEQFWESLGNQDEFYYVLVEI